MSPCRASITARSISGVTSTTVYGIRLDVAILMATAPFFPQLWPERATTGEHEVRANTRFAPTGCRQVPIQDAGGYPGIPGAPPLPADRRAAGLQPAAMGAVYTRPGRATGRPQGKPPRLGSATRSPG